MKIDEEALHRNIERALYRELDNMTGVITINVENGYIKQILLDLAGDDKEVD